MEKKLRRERRGKGKAIAWSVWLYLDEPGREREREGIPQSLPHHRSSVGIPRWCMALLLHLTGQTMRLDGGVCQPFITAYTGWKTGDLMEPHRPCLSICIDVALHFPFFSQILKASFFPSRPLSLFSLFWANASPNTKEPLSYFKVNHQHISLF